ncbi:MAG TPA: peptide-methionine (S)-S-oxide reductase MsrA [Gemmatimonadaceae bacterium]|nr:peptide-methionine (S)-S-oxide reductase MsrA [Gemmatimonadaceae bacterium]
MRTIRVTTAVLGLMMLAGMRAPAPTNSTTRPVVKTETAVFAGGCFWGIQAVFQHVKGVLSATSGYAGGWIAHPSYEDVSSGRTGHAESVKVVFDPSVVSYGTLLRVFFSVAHDPTELNRQGPDVGTQYRSIVFYTTDEQKREVQAYIDQLQKAHFFSQPIVTQVVAFKQFWIAEAYHQNFAAEHPDNAYIAINDAPKVANLRRMFPELYSATLASHE